MEATKLSLDYFYGTEPLQFSFVRIPKLLFTEDPFKKMSNDAKILYALFLDRASLSMENRWYDDQGRLYIIYAVANICADLGVATEKASKTLKELENVGLIERRKRGLGKTNIIYVKNFLTAINFRDFENRISEISENEKPDFRESNLQDFENRKSGISEYEEPAFRNSELQKFENQKPVFSNNENVELRKPKRNNTNINNTELNQTQSNQSGQMMGSDRTTELYMNLIKENIDYDSAKVMLDPLSFEMFDELYQLICDIVCVPRKEVRINNHSYPYEIVKSRFLKLKYEHLVYVLQELQKTTKPINNIRAYTVTSLYNAPMTITQHHQQAMKESVPQNGSAFTGKDDKQDNSGDPFSFLYNK